MPRATVARVDSPFRSALAAVVRRAPGADRRAPWSPSSAQQIRRTNARAPQSARQRNAARRGRSGPRSFAPLHQPFAASPSDLSANSAVSSRSKSVPSASPRPRQRVDQSAAMSVRERGRQRTAEPPGFGRPANQRQDRRPCPSTNASRRTVPRSPPPGAAISCLGSGGAPRCCARVILQRRPSVCPAVHVLATARHCPHSAPIRGDRGRRVARNGSSACQALALVLDQRAPARNDLA